MDILDLLVFVFYAAFFLLFFSYKRKTAVLQELRTIHLYGLLAKFAGALAYCVFAWNSEGTDTFAVYYPYGMNLMRLILEDFTNIKLIFTSAANFDETVLREVPHVGYMSSDSNLMVTKFTAVIGFFTLGKFMATNLFFSIIAFTGMWKLFMFFYELNPALRKAWAVVILFLPNLVFWSSSLLKDPLCIAALGWLTWSAGKLIDPREKKRGHLLNLIIWGYLLYVIKVYILLSYLPFLGFYLAFSYFSSTPLTFRKLITITAITALISMAAYFFSDFYSAALTEHLTGDFIESIISYQESYAGLDYRVGSNFSLGVELDGSTASFIKAIPYAIFATLFRPLPWEANNMNALAAALESSLIFLFTLWVILRVGIFRFFLSIFKKPAVLYILGFALTFSVFVGLTTPNFGSLSRYKVPAIPFYLAGLILILYYNNKIKWAPYTPETKETEQENESETSPD